MVHNQSLNYLCTCHIPFTNSNKSKHLWFWNFYFFSSFKRRKYRCLMVPIKEPQMVDNNYYEAINICRLLVCFRFISLLQSETSQTDIKDHRRLCSVLWCYGFGTTIMSIFVSVQFAIWEYDSTPPTSFQCCFYH